MLFLHWFRCEILFQPIALNNCLVKSAQTSEDERVWHTQDSQSLGESWNCNTEQPVQDVCISSIQEPSLNSGKAGSVQDKHREGTGSLDNGLVLKDPKIIVIFFLCYTFLSKNDIFAFDRSWLRTATVSSSTCQKNGHSHLFTSD